MIILRIILKKIIDSSKSVTKLRFYGNKIIIAPKKWKRSFIFIKFKFNVQSVHISYYMDYPDYSPQNVQQILLSRTIK